MPIPHNFVLASLFSQIGRFQKRAEQVSGTVTEISSHWLKAKNFHGIAKVLAENEELIKRATWLALGCEAQDLQGRLNDDVGDPSQPLVSLFSKIPTRNQAAVPVRYLPLNGQSAGPLYPVEKEKTGSVDYSLLWGGFNTELAGIGERLNPTAGLLLLEKYTTGMPFLLTVGTVGGDPLTDPVSDISFFDHAKLTAGIASCLYACAQEEVGWAGGNQVKYLAVGGDFSGVQDFIYRISSKGALKALRGRSFFLELLTQHAVVELLDSIGLSLANVFYAGGAQFSVLLPNTKAPREAIRKIREEINTYLAQVHGGKLYLVLESLDLADDGLRGGEHGWANAQRTLGIKISEKKRTKFSEFLRADGSRHEKPCAVCGAFTNQLKEEELKRWGLEGPLCRFCFLLVPKGPFEEPEAEKIEFSDTGQPCLWCKAKNHRLILYNVAGEFISGCTHKFCLGEMKIDECEVCHRPTLLSPLPTPEIQNSIEREADGEKPEQPDVVWACPFCRNLYHVGEHLPELKHVVRSDQSPTVQPRIFFNIGSWFYTFPSDLVGWAMAPAANRRYRAWIVNDRNPLRYVGHGVMAPLRLGNYHPNVAKEDRERLGMMQQQKALDFSNFARGSVGAQLIGVLRMDVDNLGQLFTRQWAKEAMIPARTSALSRLLTDFFTAFVNLLCDGQGLPKETASPFFLYPEGRLNAKHPRLVTVVYSGGDDLFIVGAWSEVIELAFDIHTAFGCFVCDHPEITLSGGMILQQENFPLYQMARLAKDAEEAAKGNKNSEKNSFTPFYGSIQNQQPFSWSEAEGLRKLATKLVAGLKEDGARDGTRLHLNVPRAFLTRLFDLVKTRDGEEVQLYLPRVHYLLARRDVSQELKQELVKLDSIRYLHPALLWMEFLSREDTLNEPT